MTDPAAPPPSLASVHWDGDALVIIDQRRLPWEVVHARLATVDAVVEAIRTLAVRGAPAIGICAAYGVVVGLDEAGPETADAAVRTVHLLERRIGAARPTAVNLFAALEEVRQAVDAARPRDAADVRAAALATAFAIHEADRAACAAIGRHGVELLGERRRILTHCNTGRLATAGNGTALGVVYALQEAGRRPQVLSTESRPLLQGSRLTVWELQAAGVDVRLIVDSAAGAAMQAGMVDAVILGCDRVAANGDTANKIGTYQLAVLARHHGVPFYVAGPLSTFDAATPDGRSIVVEERHADEVRTFAGRHSAPADIAVWNPAFDVTPAGLIDAFITDVGVLLPPYADSIAGALERGSVERVDTAEAVPM